MTVFCAHSVLEQLKSGTVSQERRHGPSITSTNITRLGHLKRRHGSTRVPGRALLEGRSSRRCPRPGQVVWWSDRAGQHGPSVTYIITSCWVTLLQPVRPRWAAVLGQPSSLRPTWGHSPPASSQAGHRVGPAL
jgi:hypothetical protein